MVMSKPFFLAVMVPTLSPPAAPEVDGYGKLRGRKWL